MRKLSILALFAVLVITSCQKSAVVPSSDSLNTASVNEAVAKRSNFNLLTAHTWEYVKYYTNYIDSAHPGTLAYRRGGSRNAINLDNERVTYNVDGTVTEIDQNGNYISGTWHFTNNTQTSYMVTNIYGNYYTDINFLSNKKFEWTDANAHVHGIMIPAN